MRKKRKRRAKNTGAISIGVIVLAFLAAMSIQIYRMNQKDQAYASKEEALKQQYEEETQREQELDELERYMNSMQFIEDTAKSKLGLAYENEIIFKERKE